ncbi:hypothetical protein NGRA_1694 [Nosema granulosis]|uniref:Uncharacterized protein n=1 Tax=Nosema granulosis TaxID=83296 RepID=A0A9P6GYG8_9MICR|nr:hypothetical protein NGRA_1694 [Nosema granulosis]
MQNNSGDRKINRRRTRNRTQVIHFDMSELDNLRTSQDGEASNAVEPGFQKITVDNFLNNSYNYNTEDKLKEDKHEEDKHEEDKLKEDKLKEDKLKEDKLKEDKHEDKHEDKYEKDKHEEDKYEDKLKEDTSFSMENSTATAPTVQSNSDRMFSFSEISNFFKKMEKRELFPKNKHDYIYKKSKVDANTLNTNDIMEERNIIHMRIEDELIPCLSNNPFIQADKKCRNK